MAFAQPLAPLELYGHPAPEFANHLDLESSLLAVRRPALPQLVDLEFHGYPAAPELAMLLHSEASLLSTRLPAPSHLVNLDFHGYPIPPELAILLDSESSLLDAHPPTLPQMNLMAT
ncbi:hypothetical protein HDU98_003400 [Podochytrium sp. JEL0797]|nr:hypothetical protein HDU98_003400 [Podochytrium sp. JEL0797]